MLVPSLEAVSVLLACSRVFSLFTETLVMLMTSICTVSVSASTIGIFSTSREFLFTFDAVKDIFIDLKIF
jgi:hypothetical protein